MRRQSQAGQRQSALRRVQRWILVLLEQVALVALLARKLHRSHMKGDDVVSAFRYLREPYEKRFYWWEIVASGAAR
jgi:hypothetical protein